MKLTQLRQLTPSAYLALDEVCYADASITPLFDYQLLCCDNNEKVDSVDSNDEMIAKIVDDLNTLPLFSLSYAGHQFGEFTLHLGDGRVVHLGDIDREHLQLKGSGVTPYARLGDGRLSLQEGIKEYLMNHALCTLGIKSVRSIALIQGGRHVGVEGKEEACSMLLRSCPTWVRFGSFEQLYALGKHALLRDLADVVIRESFPSLCTINNAKERYTQLYQEVIHQTTQTIAHWQSVGFVHGVMNSDNLLIDGTTVDSGSGVFMEILHFDRIVTSIDKQGLYSFRNQPHALKWALEKLARALSPLVEYEELVEILDASFWLSYQKHYDHSMRHKLGLYEATPLDRELYRDLLTLLVQEKISYHSFFYRLCFYDPSDRSIAFTNRTPSQSLCAWLDRYDQRLAHESLSSNKRKSKMRRVNPSFTLVDYLLDEVIEEAKEGKFDRLHEVIELINDPFREVQAEQ
jgi:uncharacterized protein YdiU (UPF0061 family)